MTTRTSLEYRFHTVEKDLTSIINECAEFVACDPNESQIEEFNSDPRGSSQYKLRRFRSLSPTSTFRRCTRDVLYSPGLHNRQFTLFNRLPKELRLQIWETSVVPEVVIGRLIAKNGKVGNSVMLDSYSGRQLIPFEGSTRFGTKKHYKRIRLYEINSETRALAIKYWGNPLPPACATNGVTKQHPNYLFRSDTDILAIHLHKLPHGHHVDNSTVTHDLSPWQGRGYPNTTPPAPHDLLSRIQRIELHLDRVEDLRDMGYNWTGSQEANPFTFLFHFPNLLHLTFVFRRPQLADIPHTSNGKTMIDNNSRKIIPVTEAVRLFDYYHADTIHCLHAFSRLLRHRTTHDRAKHLLHKLKTLTIKANTESLAIDPYYFPENVRPTIPIARLPKGMSPLGCAQMATLEIVPHDAHMGPFLDFEGPMWVNGMSLQPTGPMTIPMLVGPTSLIHPVHHHPQQQQPVVQQPVIHQPVIPQPVINQQYVFPPGAEHGLGFNMGNFPGLVLMDPMPLPMGGFNGAGPTAPTASAATSAAPTTAASVSTAPTASTTAASATPTTATSLTHQQAASASSITLNPAGQLQAWTAQQEVMWQVNHVNNASGSANSSASENGSNEAGEVSEVSEVSEAEWSTTYLNPEDQGEGGGGGGGYMGWNVLV